MIRTIDLRGQQLSRAELLALVPRNAADPAAALAIADELVSAVRDQGELALREQALRLDRVEGHSIRVPRSHFEDALASLDESLKSALEVAIARVRAGSAAQVPAATTTTIATGAVIEQRWQPVERVGLYVPGGKAVYPSSVIMNVVAAQAAGVSSIAIASPPQHNQNGRVHSTILAAAALLGIDEVYAMGGAGAIGALAYGISEIGLDPVNVVTGPGNVYVAAAKRVVRGRVGIDSEAGPTEILVIADDSANASFVAADLISQAEHDEMASSILVTTSPEIASAVAAEVDAQASVTTHAPRVEVALSGTQSAIVIVDDIHAAIDFSNAYAPEHLEIQTKNADEVAKKTVNAGAIFIGDYTPVSLGDYSAGSNHVLPTAGQAMFSSGLGAYTFLRPQQVISYSRDALSVIADGIQLIARDEELPAHGDAIAIRFGEVQ